MSSAKTAVVCIDVQNDFCASGGIMDRLGRDVTRLQAVLPNIEQLLQFSREQNLKVIFVKLVSSEETDSPVWNKRPAKGLLEPGEDVCRSEWGQSFYQIEPLPSEPVVTKHRFSCFIGTNLDQILRAQGIDTLVLCGFLTNVCVESTAREAHMMDYRVITLADCTSTYDEADHQHSLRTLDRYFGTVLSLDQFIEEYKTK